MNEQIVGQLQELNLSLNEAKVYSTLLEIGQTSAGEIIKKTQLHRSVVYETLDKLISKKLTFRLEKQNITFFQATDPQRILQNIKSQEDLALELIPKLKSIIDMKLPEITIYEGIEAYRRFWLDCIKRLPEGSVDCVAGSIGGKWWDYMRNDAKIYHEIKAKRKIKWKMIIFNKDPLDLGLLKSEPKLHEYRLIKKDVSLEGNFNVLGKESVILHSATEPMIIEVKNPTLVKVFQNIFDILWSIGKRV